jgi:hypothetical protein
MTRKIIRRYRQRKGVSVGLLFSPSPKYRIPLVHSLTGGIPFFWFTAYFKALVLFARMMRIVWHSIFASPGMMFGWATIAVAQIRSIRHFRLLIRECGPGTLDNSGRWTLQPSPLVFYMKLDLKN